MTVFTGQANQNPNGVGNAPLGGTMAQSGVPDPSYSHLFHNDFNTYAAGDWTITSTGGGTAALTAGDGGLLLVTTTSGATDTMYLQTTVAGFTINSGKQLFFKFVGKLHDVTLPNFYCGLINTTTTPLAPTDGIFFVKAANAATVQLQIWAGSSNTLNISLPTGANTMAIDTLVELGFYIDVYGNVAAYFNPQTGTQLPATGVAAVRGRVAQAAVPTLPTVALAPSFGMLNSTAVAKTLTVDYITVSNER